MNYNATNIENDVFKSYVYTKYLDSVAKTCASSTMWQERDVTCTLKIQIV